MFNPIVLSIGRNPNKFLVECVQSVKKQTRKPNKQIIVDANSNDDTDKYLSLYEKDFDISIHAFKERRYKSQNLFEEIHKLNDEDVVFILDSDDVFSDENVIQLIMNEYENNSNLEYVYTNYKFSHGVIGENAQIPNDSWDPYKSRWMTSHLTTFKAKRFKKLNKLNFLDQNGEWVKMACDQAINLPMLYSIWKEEKNYSKVKFINKICYIYNFFGNPHKIRASNSEDSNNASKYSSLIRERGFVE